MLPVSGGSWLHLIQTDTISPRQRLAAAGFHGGDQRKGKKKKIICASLRCLLGTMVQENQVGRNS